MYLLASDFDGTLALKNEEIRKEDLSKIKSFIELGNHFMIVSGRTVKSLKRICMSNDLQYSYLIACTGSYIVDSNDNCIYQSIINYQTYLNIMDIVKGSDYISHTLCNGYHAGLKLMIPYEQHPFSRYNRDLSDFVQIEDVINDTITQANFLYRDLNELNKVVEKLKTIKQIDVHVNGYNIDITASEINKAKAIEKILQVNQYKEVYTIGDGLNDLDMINQFYGFAISSGNDYLKQCAKKVVNNIGECIDLIGV